MKKKKNNTYTESIESKQSFNFYLEFNMKTGQ